MKGIIPGRLIAPILPNLEEVTSLEETRRIYVIFPGDGKQAENGPKMDRKIDTKKETISMAIHVPDGIYDQGAIDESLRLRLVASLGNERANRTYAATVWGGVIVTTFEYRHDEDGRPRLDDNKSLIRDVFHHDPPILLVESPK